jgi:hypothetical protein
MGKLRLLIDSGAFTAWKVGKPILLDDYCRFLESLAIKPFRYFTLDVIGDPAGSMRNYEIMLKRGFTPIPVFTRGEEPSVIDDYYKTSDLIAIGGLVGTSRNKGFVKGISPFLKGRNIHLLGFTNKTFIKILRPFSCDSSSVFCANRFGILDLFDLSTGSWIKLGRNDFIKRPSDQIIKIIESYGVTPSSLAIRMSWEGSQPYESMRLSFRSHIRSSIAYENRLNVKYFLAFVHNKQLGWLLDAYRKELSIHDRMHAKGSVLLGSSSPES